MAILQMILSGLLIVAAYLLGSISTAILVCRVFKLPDPRTQGSGNPGATNVLRLGGREAAVFTLLGDVAKSALPVVLGRFIGATDLACSFIGLAAFFGHIYPIFFDFKGGKGVATAFGVVLGLSPLLGVMAALTWLAVYALFRYSSLAAIITAIMMPTYLLFQGHFSAFPIILTMSLILMWRHKANLKRLLNGTEPKTG